MDYMNEFDPFAAEWCRNLIGDGHIPEATVDERSIKDVSAIDLVGYPQCHFFAGIGGWPLAFKLAGWPADLPVWSGSCPCQPFSAAGSRKGEADERHLWPELRRLIAERKPPVCFGEQVASSDGRKWLAGVRADLGALGYRVGAADLCAAGSGSPHIRQRLYWVAERMGAGGRADMHGRGCGERGERDSEPIRGLESSQRDDAGRCGATGGLGDTEGERESAVTGSSCQGILQPNGNGGLVLPGIARPQGYGGDVHDGDQSGRHGAGPIGRSSAATGAWADSFAIPCRDGKARRIGSCVQPLAHGFSRSVGPIVSRMEGMGIDAATAKKRIKLARRNRVGRLKGYGNAIVPQVAARFIRAYMEATGMVD